MKTITTMKKVNDLFIKSDMTLQQLGDKMRFTTTHARQRVRQFLTSKDPRLSTICRFLDAIGARIADLSD